jgi:formylglycine-generating enzyme
MKSPMMILVKGGSYDMGSNDGYNDEKPIHSVTLSDFYIGKYEVTQEQYEKVMGKNPSYFTNAGKNAPVESVSWYDAVEFCNKLSEMEGLNKCYSGSGGNIKCDFSKNGYRLPTEAEWEYAAHGGNQSKGYKYSGSDNIDEVAWYWNNSSSITHIVGTKTANELGIYDMSGNVWEWVWDMFYVANSKNRVLRGGSWGSDANLCTVSSRGDYYAADTIVSIGFRLCRNYDETTFQKSLQEPKLEPEISRIFNAFPLETRIISSIVANGLQINCLKHERYKAIIMHTQNMKEINEHIKRLERWRTDMFLKYVSKEER